MDNFIYEIRSILEQLKWESLNRGKNTCQNYFSGAFKLLIGRNMTSSSNPKDVKK